MSPLMLAAYYGDADMTAFLLARHADVNKTWSYQGINTPLLWAHNHKDTAVLNAIWEHVNRYCLVVAKLPPDEEEGERTTSA